MRLFSTMLNEHLEQGISVSDFSGLHLDAISGGCTRPNYQRKEWDYFQRIQNLFPYTRKKHDNDLGKHIWIHFYRLDVSIRLDFKKCLVAAIGRR